jgi:hypothetical protein
MLKRIQIFQRDAMQKISEIQQIDETVWNRRRLLEEWTLKKQHHLDTKDCALVRITTGCNKSHLLAYQSLLLRIDTDIQLSTQVRSLLEASRNGQGLTKLLSQIQQERNML